MNPQQLQLPDGTKVNAFICASCKRLWPESRPYMSERCCKCDNCGVKTSPSRSRCQSCVRKIEATKEMERLDRATVIQDYTGPVFWSDRYWESLDSFLDDWENESEEVPEFVWACDIFPRVSIDIDNVIENQLQDANIEDDDLGPDDLEGVDELRKAVKTFNTLNEKTVYWDYCLKQKVPTSVSSLPASAAQGKPEWE